MLDFEADRKYLKTFIISEIKRQHCGIIHTPPVNLLKKIIKFIGDNIFLPDALCNLILSYLFTDKIKYSHTAICFAPLYIIDEHLLKFNITDYDCNNYINLSIRGKCVNIHIVTQCIAKVFKLWVERAFDLDYTLLRFINTTDVFWCKSDVKMDSGRYKKKILLFNYNVNSKKKLKKHYRTNLRCYVELMEVLASTKKHVGECQDVYFLISHLMSPIAYHHDVQYVTFNRNYLDRIMNILYHTVFLINLYRNL